MLTRDQKYSIDIHKRVLKIYKEKTEADRNSYGAMAHKLPVLIRSAGLAQALAFVQSRGKESQRDLLQDLARTMGKQDADALLTCSRESVLSTYMLLTQQVLDALLWYKRFAQSVLDVQDANSDQEETINNG